MCRHLVGEIRKYAEVCSDVFVTPNVLEALQNDALDDEDCVGMIFDFELFLFLNEIIK